MHSTTHEARSRRAADRAAQSIKENNQFFMKLLAIMAAMYTIIGVGLWLFVNNI